MSTQYRQRTNRNTIQTLLTLPNGSFRCQLTNKMGIITNKAQERKNDYLRLMGND